MAEQYDSSYRLRNCTAGRITYRGFQNRGIDRHEGEVLTPNGIVTVYTRDGLTRMDFVDCGRLYIRVWDERLTPRQLILRAKAFAREKACE